MKTFNIIALITAILMAHAGVSQAASGFANTCRDIRIDQLGGLYARCQTNDDESTRDSFYPLTYDVMNVGGNLEWRLGGGFAESCMNCGVSYGVMECDCRKWNGRYQYTELNINAHIENRNGYLFP